MRETSKKINESGTPLVLFGHVYYPAIENYLKQLKVDIAYICDNNPDKKGESLYGCSVISPYELDQKYDVPYNVLILVPYEEEICEQLQRLKASPQEIFYLDFYFYEEGAAESYLSNNMDDVQKVYQSLADQHSRDSFLAAIQYWLSRENTLLKPISVASQNQYFPDDIFTLGDNEVFVDAGAFTGDTVQKFIKRVGNKYASIHAFEPEADNFRMLKKVAEAYKNIHIYQMGLSDAQEWVSFHSDTSSSKIDVKGHTSVQVDTLDYVLGDRFPVTFLKMDIEGAECAALRGAADTIKHYKPKLAICTYHSIVDMIRVPLLIKEIDADYSLYFRHYTNGIVESVCYGIPKKIKENICEF